MVIEWIRRGEKVVVVVVVVEEALMMEDELRLIPVTFIGLPRP
jgi:hypothetical protein